METSLTAAALRRTWDRKIYYTNCPVVNALVIAYEKGWLQEGLRKALAQADLEAVA